MRGENRKMAFLRSKFTYNGNVWPEKYPLKSAHDIPQSTGVSSPGKKDSIVGPRKNYNGFFLKNGMMVFGDNNRLDPLAYS